MIYLVVPMFYFCLCFPYGVLPLSIDLNARVHDYFVKRNIMDPTSNERAIARDLIFDCHKAEEKADGFKEELGKVRGEKANCKKPLQVLGACLKVEGLVNKVYPLRQEEKCGVNTTVYGKPERLSIGDALHEIVFSQASRFTEDPYVRMFRDRLRKKKMSGATFMKFVRWLYREFSDEAAHKMAQFSPPLPKYDDFEGIERMLSCVEIDQDVPAILCIQVILEPFDNPPYNETTTTTMDVPLPMMSPIDS